MLLGGDVAGARTVLQAAYDAGPTEGAGRAHIAAHLALACAVAGELRAAEQAAVVAEASGAEQEQRTRDALGLARTILLIDHGRLAEVARLTERRPPSSYPTLAEVAMWVHAQVLLMTDRAAEGLRLLEQTADGPLDERAAICRATRADLNLALGDVREAWVAVEPGSARTAWSAVAEASVLYVSGEFETVRYAARVARAGHDLTVRESVRLRGIEAAACLATGDEDGAGRLLLVAVDAARQQDWHAVASSLPLPLVAFAHRTDLLPAGIAERAGSWIPGPALAAPLSPRERIVLRLLLEGADRAGIADRLGVSVNTVKTQIRSLYAKLGVTSRGEVRQKVALMPPAWTHDALDV